MAGQQTPLALARRALAFVLALALEERIKMIGFPMAAATVKLIKTGKMLIIVCDFLSMQTCPAAARNSPDLSISSGDEGGEKELSEDALFMW